MPKISLSGQPFFFLLLIFSCFNLTGCNKDLGEETKTQPNEINIASDKRTSERTGTNQPNIIIILSDDIGYEIPTYTGGQSYETPNIDALASLGTQFTQCNSSPTCSPSRFMLLTGKYNFRNYFNQFGSMDTSQRTIANMLKDAGYETCVAGKWQLDGGDASIKKFGFKKYLVTNPFKINSRIYKYKDPQIYERGRYWASTYTTGLYGEDIIRNYLFNFIDSNIEKPFFAYWSMNLCHDEFCPTPDDAAFATWNSRKKPVKADTVWLPSMVKYMDKQVGMLIEKLNTTGLINNTVVIFLGDNGTTKGIHSLFNGEVVEGGKSLPIVYGTHVPMIVYDPAGLTNGATNNNLVDFTDFLPSLATIAKTPLPPYGILDGVNFMQVNGMTVNEPRTDAYCYYDPHPELKRKPKIWTNDATYKLYNPGILFYNYAKDPLELNPLTDSLLTPEELEIKQRLLTDILGKK